jgi:hypothetical protein
LRIEYHVKVSAPCFQRGEPIHYYGGTVVDRAEYDTLKRSQSMLVDEIPGFVPHLMICRHVTPPITLR